MKAPVWPLLLCLFSVSSCGDGPLPERARSNYGSFEDEVFAVLEREFELAAPRDQGPARIAALHAMTDDPVVPGRYVREALRTLIRSPVNSGLRPVIESTETLALYDDGSIGRLGEFLAGVFETMEQETASEGVSAGVPEALSRLAAAPAGSNPDAWLRLIHRAAGVEEVFVPRDGALEGEVNVDKVPAEVLPGLARLYVEHAERLEEVHQWLADELESLEPADEAVSLEPPLLDRGRERFLESVCAGMENSVTRRVCEADLELISLGAPAWTVLLEDDGRPVPNPNAPEELVGISPFANKAERGERRGGAEEGKGLAFDSTTGQPIYRYLNLKHSFLGLLIAAQRGVLERGAHWDLLSVVEALQGSRSGPNGALRREDNVLLDLGWVVRELASYPRLAILLGVVAGVVADGHGTDLLVDSLSAFGRASSLMRGANLLTPANTLADDLIGGNELRALEEGKECWAGGPYLDHCGASWLRCDVPLGAEADPWGLCTRHAPVPSILEELVEPISWTDTRGARHQRPAIIRRLFESMERELTQLSGLPNAMATMMEYSVQTDTGQFGDLSCQDLDLYPEVLDDLHVGEGAFVTRTGWSSAEALLGAAGPQHATDPTRSLYQKVLALVADTNRAGFDVVDGLLGVENTHLLDMPSLAVFYLDAAADNLDLDTAPMGLPVEGVSRDALVHLALCEMVLSDFPSDPHGDDNPLTPTAEQANLFLIRDHAFLADDPVARGRIGNPTCNQSVPVREHLGSMLVALKRGGLLDSLRPVIKIFSRVGMEDEEPDLRRNMLFGGGRTQLLADLMSTLHLHYSERRQSADTPIDGTPAGLALDKHYGTGMRRAEPFLSGIVRDPRSNRNVLRLFFEVGAYLHKKTVCLDPDKAGGCIQGAEFNAADELSAFLAWLADRDEPPTPRPERVAEWGDQDANGAYDVGVMRGNRDPFDRETRPSRLHLLLEALRRIDDRLALPGFESAAAAWGRLDMARLFLDVDGEGQLLNPGTPYLLRSGLAVAANALEQAHREEACPPFSGEPCPSFQASVAEGYADLAELVSTPGWAAAMDLLRASRHDPEIRRGVDVSLRLALRADAEESGDVSGALLELVAQLLQTRVSEADLREVARYVGRTMRLDGWFVESVGDDGALGEGGQSGALPGVVSILAQLTANDPGQVLPALLRNLSMEDRTRSRSRFALRTLKDLFASAARLDPTEQRHFSANDYRTVVSKTARFLRDEVHGFERIVDVVKSRLPEQGASGR